jgi:hypothetical protein
MTGRAAEEVRGPEYDRELWRVEAERYRRVPPAPGRRGAPLSEEELEAFDAEWRGVG